MDYDEAGRKSVEQFVSNKFKIRWVSTTQIVVNGKTTILDKDISDYVYSHGAAAGLARMKEMFPEIPKENFRNDRPAFFAALKDKIINE